MSVEVSYCPAKGWTSSSYLTQTPFHFGPFLDLTWAQWMQMMRVILSLSLQRLATELSSPHWIRLSTVSTELKGKCKDSLDRLLLLPTGEEKVLLEQRKKQEGKGGWMGWSPTEGSWISFGEACVWAGPVPSRIRGDCLFLLSHINYMKLGGWN